MKDDTIECIMIGGPRDGGHIVLNKRCARFVIPVRITERSWDNISRPFINKEHVYNRRNDKLIYAGIE